MQWARLDEQALMQQQDHALRVTNSDVASAAEAAESD